MKTRYVRILEIGVKECFEILRKERNSLENAKKFRKVVRLVSEQYGRSERERETKHMLTPEETEKLYQLIEREIDNYKKNKIA